MRGLRSDPSKFAGLALAFESSLILLAVLLGWLTGTPAFDRLHFSLDGTVLGLLATLPALLAVALCSRSRWEPLRRLTRLSRRQLAPLFEGTSLTRLALISIAAGVGEEALFRGVIQFALADILPLPVAVICASLLFGLAHWITLPYAVFATLFGLYLGWVTLASDNLLSAIICHSLYDWLILCYLVRQPAPASARNRR